MINNKFRSAKVEKIWLHNCFLTVFISFKVNYFQDVFWAGLHTCFHGLSALVLPAKAVFRDGWRVAPMSLLPACYTSAFQVGAAAAIPAAKKMWKFVNVEM